MTNAALVRRNGDTFSTLKVLLLAVLAAFAILLLGGFAERAYAAVCTGTAGDEFDGTSLDRTKWPTMLREHPGDFSVSDGTFRQRVLRGDMNTASTASTRNMPLQVLPNGAWTVTAKVNIAETIQSDRIGLLAWRGEAPHTWGKISFMNRENEGALNEWRVERKATANNTTQGATVATTNAPRSQLTNNDFWLRIVSDGAGTPNLTYQYSLNGTTFTTVGASLALAGTAPIQVTLVARGHDVVNATTDLRSVAVPERSVNWDWVRVDTTNCPPAVNLATTDATQGAAPLNVAFQGTVTNGVGGDSNPALSWDYGDGTTESGQTARSHTFTTPGTYRVRLTATDSFGNARSDSVWVTVTDPATPACTDNFNGNSLNLSNSNEFKWDSVLSSQDRAPNAIAGKLRIPIMAGDWGETSSHGMPVPLALAPDGGWTATAKLNLADINAENEQTGLIIHKSHGPSSSGPNGNNVNGSNEFSKLIYINKGAAAHQFEFSVTSRASLAYTTAPTQLAAPAPYNAAGNNEVYLRVRYDGWKLIGEWSPNGTTWTQVGLPANMAPEPGKPIKVGLIAGRPTGTGTAANMGGNVDFDWFSIGCGATVSLDASDNTLVGSGTVDFEAAITGTPTSIAWDFGDGTTATGQTERSHNFTAPGTYRVIVTVTDADGNVNTANQTVTVSPEPGGCVDASSDEFSGNMLDPKWDIVRPRISTVNVGGGSVSIKGNGGDISGAAADNSNMLLQDAPPGDWTAITKMDVGEMADSDEHAGIVVWLSENPNNFAKIFVNRRSAGNSRFERQRTLGGGTSSGGNNANYVHQAEAHARITKTGNMISTQLSLDGVNWQQPANDFDLTQFTAGSQIRIGLFYRQPSSVHRTVSFDYFRVQKAVCDSTAPTTAISVAPATADGLEGWYVSKPVTVTLTATDNEGGDGIDRTEYRINGGSWSNYTAPVSINTEGEHLLEYRSIDNNGNQEAIQSRQIDIDTVQPSASHTLNPASGPYIAPGPVTVTLNGSDATSGVVRVEYSTNGGSSWSTYTSPLSYTNPGNVAIQYRAVDEAGNVQSPVGNVSFEIIAGGNNDCLTSQTDEFTGGTLDPKWTVNNPNAAGNLAVSGGSLNQVLLTGDIGGDFGGAAGAKNTVLQPLPQVAQGKRWVATTKIDLSDVWFQSNQLGFVLWANGQTAADGNNRQWAKITTAKRGTAPANNNWWIEWSYRNGGTNTSQNMGDQPDKPDAIYQRLISNGATPPFIRTDYSFDGVHWMPVGAAGGFTFNGGSFLNNLHIGLSAFAFSDGGQTSTKFDYLRVCNPEDDLYPPSTTVALDPETGFGPSGAYTSPVNMTLTADDGIEGSTVDYTEYRVNGGSWIRTQHTRPVRFSAEGNYIVEYRSADVAGNQETARTVTFNINYTGAGNCTVDSDPFDGSSLNASRWDLQLRAGGVTVGGGQLSIPITNSDYNGGTSSAPTVLTQTPDGSWAAETQIDFSAFGAQEGNQAGIVVWQNEGAGSNNFTKFVVNRRAVPNYWVERVRTVNSTNASGFPNGGAFSVTGINRIGVRVEYNDPAQTLNFRYSLDGGVTWLKPTNVVADLSGDFSTGTRVGLAAMGGSGATGTARFDSFRVSSAACENAVAPTVSMSVPAPTGAGGWHTTKPVPVTVATNDPTGLVTETQYRVGGSGGYSPYTSPVQVSTEGQTLVESRLRVGDTFASSTASETLKIDTVAPVVSHTLNPPSGPYASPTPVSVNVSATDASSGVASVEVSLDGGSTWSAFNPGSPPTFTAVGSHTVRYRATDNVGHTSAVAQAVVNIEPAPGNGACLNSATDEFNGSSVDPKWSILRPVPARYSVGSGRLNLLFGGVNTELNGGTANAQNVFRQPTPATGAWSVTTRMDLTQARQQSNQAGMVLWQNEGSSLNNFARITFNARPTDATPGWWVERQATVNSSTSGNDGGNNGTFPFPYPDELFMRLVVVPDGANRIVTSYYSHDGYRWSQIRSPFTISNAATYPIQAGLVLVRGENNPTGGVGYEYFHMCQFANDNEAPISNSSLTPETPTGNNGWYRGPANVAVNVEAIDVEPGSGVARIETSVDSGSSWQTYSGPLTVLAQGETPIRYRAVDQGGNVEAFKTQTVKIDNVSPTSSHSTTPASGPHITPTTVAVNLSGTDAHSGIEKIEYSTNGGSTWSTYVPATPPSFSTAGFHEVMHRAVDNAGNVETAKTAVIEIESPVSGGDTTQPSTSRVITPAAPSGANGWYTNTGGVSIQLTATDNAGGSGVKEIRYRLGSSGAFTVVTGATTTVNLTAAGQNTLQYQAVDNDNNVEDLRIVDNVWIDSAAPSPSHSVENWGDPHENLKRVTISAADGSSGSGVAKIEYSLNGGSTWTDYTAPIVLATVGTHTVHYRASDIAGNTSSSSNVQVTVDAPGFPDPGELDPVVLETPVSSPLVLPLEIPLGSEAVGVKYKLTQLPGTPGSAWTNYTPGNPVTVVTPGEWRVDFRYVYGNGSESATNILVFTVVPAPDPAVPGIAPLKSKLTVAGKKKSLNVDVNVSNTGGSPFEDATVCVKVSGSAKLKVSGPKCKSVSGLEGNRVQKLRFKITTDKKKGLGKSGKVTFTLTGIGLERTTTVMTIKRKKR